MKRAFSFLIILFLFYHYAAFAACTKTTDQESPLPDTWTAADCSNAEISACISAATSGDTINVPEGPCTWTDSVTILENKTIKLIGAGSDKTIISRAGLMLYSLSPNSRISGFRFNLTGSGSSPMISVRNTGWRIDNNYFDNQTGSTKEAINPTGVNMTMMPEGVIDHNYLNECRISSDGMGTFDKASAMWAQDHVLGSANTVFVEDNTIVRTTATTSMDANSAGRYVFRYNTVIGVPVMAHSAQGYRATRAWEVYGNSFTFTNSTFNYIGFMRGGTGTFFYNSTNGPYSTGYSINLDEDRVFRSRGTYGICDGTAPYGYDGNSINGWPCRDQIGRGKDSSLSSATDMKSQASDPVYFWTNKRSDGTNVLAKIVNGCSDYIQANRDYYDYNTSFNGTSGTGCGTLAAIPATCTTGVGYWATDQSCSDLTGMVGANPGTPISGTLYKCTATDTWASSYTPYTYPHPLRTEEGPPDFTITVTNTGTGHSPSHDGARTVQTGGTLTFTSGVYNGWQIVIGGTCGCATDGCTVTPTENCTITCTSSAIQLMPW